MQVLAATVTACLEVLVVAVLVLTVLGAQVLQVKATQEETLENLGRVAEAHLRLAAMVQHQEVHSRTQMGSAVLARPRLLPALLLPTPGAAGVVVPVEFVKLRLLL